MDNSYSITLNEGTVKADLVETELLNTDELYAKSKVVVGDVDGTDEILRQAQIYLPDTIPAVMESGHVYDMGVLSSNQDLSLIIFKDVNSDSSTKYVQTCEIWMETGNTAYTITWPVTSKWPDESMGAITSVTLMSNTRYRFAVRSEGDGTMVITKAYEYSVII